MYLFHIENIYLKICENIKCKIIQEEEFFLLL